MQTLSESPVSLEVVTVVRRAETEVLLVVGVAAVGKCAFLHMVSSMGELFGLTLVYTPSQPATVAGTVTENH